MQDLATSIRQPPGSPEGARLASWLRALERTGDGWEPLFEALMPVADRVAREFPDVMSVDEARASCMGVVYERSVGGWLDAVARGTTDKPFAFMVGDQLREQLRTIRRTRARRAEKDRALADEVGRSAAPPPDGATHLRELLERVESAPELDARDRRIFAMLAHGHEQQEIARIESVSEATISRAVARLRVALGQLGLSRP